jgi:6-phosphogluconate dehydrogenase
VELGMIGLGRMGAGMATRLLRGGHRVVVHDLAAESIQQLAELGALPAFNLAEAPKALVPPRVIWLLLPAGPPVDRAIESLVPHLAAGDLLVDAGNSYFKDSQRRASTLGVQGIHFLDVGTSGGIWGLEGGYCLMVGGDGEAVQRIVPALQTLAPAPDRGWGHVGPSGAGHFVKMVHNGIEYGMMESYAEGFAILKHKEDFSLDLHQVTEIWRQGSVIRSWLLELLAAVFEENPSLEGIAPLVDDSGYGRQTVSESVDLDLSAPAITLALLQRLRSRDRLAFSDKILAALRNKFGGHAIHQEPKE